METKESPNELIYDVETTITTLDDVYWKNKKEMKHVFRELVDLIPDEQVNNPNLNGFYRVSGMDDTWVNKQNTETQNRINRLNEIFRGRSLEHVIAEAFHRATVDNSNPELIKRVKVLLKQ